MQISFIYILFRKRIRIIQYHANWSIATTDLRVFLTVPTAHHSLFAYCSSDNLWWWFQEKTQPRLAKWKGCIKIGETKGDLVIKTSAEMKFLVIGSVLYALYVLALNCLGCVRQISTSMSSSMFGFTHYCLWEWWAYKFFLPVFTELAVVQMYYGVP